MAHQTAQIAEHAVLFKNNRILLLWRENEQAYQLPGGRLEEGEEAGEGLLREIREETGFSMRIEEFTPLTSWMFDREQELKYGVVFTAQAPDEEVRVSEPHTTHIWASGSDIEDVPLTSPSLRSVLRTAFARRIGRDTNHLSAMIAEYACLFRGETMLVLRLEDRSRALSGWHLPGGRLDEGESSVEGLCREIREEVGLRMNPGDLQVFRTMLIDPDRLKYAAIFIADAPEGDVTTERDDTGTNKRHAWMGRDEIARARFAFPELTDAALQAFTLRSH